MNDEPIDICPQCGNRMRITKTGRPTVVGRETVRDRTRFCSRCKIVIRSQSVEKIVLLKKKDTCVQKNVFTLARSSDCDTTDENILER